MACAARGLGLNCPDPFGILGKALLCYHHRICIFGCGVSTLLESSGHFMMSFSEQSGAEPSLWHRAGRQRGCQVHFLSSTKLPADHDDIYKRVLYWLHFNPFAMFASIIRAAYLYTDASEVVGGATCNCTVGQGGGCCETLNPKPPRLQIREVELG